MPRVTVHRLILSWGRTAGLAAAVGIVYFFVARLSLALLVAPDGVAAFWPAAGVSSGILIALGPKARWPVVAGVIAATLVANLTGDRNILASTTFAVANAAEAAITSDLIRRYIPGDFNLGELRQVFGLLAAAIIGTAISGVIGTIGYKFFHSPTVPVLITWWHWFASDVIGIVAVAPLMIRIGGTFRDPPTRAGVIEGLAALVVLGAITAAVISLPEQPWKTTLPVALLFPILLWLAVRCQLIFSAAGAFIVSLTVVWTTIFGIGHFGDPGLSVSDRLLQAQAMILVVTIGTSVLSALFAERRTSAARLANSYRLLEHERDSKLLNVEAAVAWIAHELSQPLTGVSTNTSAALRYLRSLPPDEDRAEAALESIAGQAARVHEIFGGIRAFFQSGAAAYKPINVNELIRLVLDTFGEEIVLHRIVVHLALAPNLPTGNGNASQLQQVISNLVRNAIEAMATTEDRPRELRLTTELHGRDTIRIAVEDSGPGIDSAQLDNAFGPFFTTKRGGMGLGLAICRLIIERHGGGITVSSDGRTGAHFDVILPAVSETKPVAPSDTSAPTSSGWPSASLQH